MPDSPIRPRAHRQRATWTRRQFVNMLTRSAAAGAFLKTASPAFAVAQKGAFARRARPKQVAIIATEVRKLCHAQHFIDRFLEGYGWHGQHHYPSLKLASLYVDQFPENDLSRDRARRHGVKIYS